MHAYSFSRLRRQLPRGGSLHWFAQTLQSNALCALKTFQYESFCGAFFQKATIKDQSLTAVDYLTEAIVDLTQEPRQE